MLYYLNTPTREPTGQLQALAGFSECGDGRRESEPESRAAKNFLTGDLWKRFFVRGPGAKRALRILAQIAERSFARIMRRVIRITVASGASW